MDSGNSGSIQSSSGGSEEYDSRAESISAFLNNNPSSHIGPFGSQPPEAPPPPPPQQQNQAHSPSRILFDPLSNYFNQPLSRSNPPPPQLTTNPNSLLNLDALWSKNLRSDPNCTDLGGFMAASSSSSPTQQLFNNQQIQIQIQTQTQTRPGATFPSMQISQGAESANKSSISGTSDQPNNSNNNNSMARNPKKRSRASRRAPTTVLTTDTSNFRAMVQEFTGIPASPFKSSPFPRARVDLFGTPSAMRSTTASLDPSPPHYLLRPFPQKIQPPNFTSSMIEGLGIASNATTNNTTNTATTTTTSGSASASASLNYQIPSDQLGFLKQPQNNFSNINMQNPILNFQSLLQPPQKYPIPNSNEFSLKMGVFEDFGLSHHGHVNTNLRGLQEMVTSDGGALPTNHQHPSWGGSEGHDQSLLRSINGDKGPENNVVATRTEGMVEPWICSSD